MAPKKEADYRACLAVALALVGLLLYKLSPVLLYLAGGLVFMLILYVSLEAVIGSPGYARVLLGMASVLTISVAAGWRSVVACLVASATWLIALRLTKRHLLQHEDGLTAAVVRNGMELAAALTIATALLTGLSIFLTDVPPDNILEWSQHLGEAKEALEKAGTYATESVVTAGIAWFAFSWRRNAAGRLAFVWRGAGVARTWIKRGAVVLMAVTSFTFTAANAVGPNSWDGPLIALSKANIETLAQYEALQWKIELQLGAEMKLQAVSAIYSHLLPQDRTALSNEIELDNRAAGIPSEYFKADPPHETADDLLKFRADGFLRSVGWLKALPENSPSSTAAALSPPTGTTRRSIARTVEGVDRASQGIESPEWMKGIGTDVSKKFFDLSLNTDYVPFLKELGKSHPLLSEVLGVAIDGIKEVLYDRVQRRAAGLEAEFVRAGSAGPDQQIRAAAAELLGRVRQPSHEKIAGLERAQQERAVQIDNAYQRLRGDMDVAIRDSTAKADAWAARLAELGIAEQSTDGTEKLVFESIGIPSTDLPPAGPEPSLATLRRQVDRIKMYQSKAAEALPRAPDVAEWRRVLGSDFDLIKSQSESSHAAQVAVEETRHEIERRSGREVER